MGLFGLLGSVLTLPVKVVTLPVKVLEAAVESNPKKRPVTQITKTVTDTVEEALEELDE